MLNQSPSEFNSPLASSSQRLFTIGGLLLCLVGMLLGDVFAVFILHPSNDSIGGALYNASLLIPSGDIEGIQQLFMSIGHLQENKGTKIDAHSHIIHLGYIALLLAILQPYVNLSHTTKSRLAYLYIASSIALPPAIFAIYYVGLAYSPFEHIGWASIIADASGGLLALIILTQFYGLWSHWHNKRENPHPDYLNRGGTPSNILLIGGLLLLISGFLFGAGYGLYTQYIMDISDTDLLKNIVAHAAASQTDLLNQDFSAFGNYLAFRGISVAAHTHFNEMGILLLLLAFAQPFIFYQQVWKQRWAKLAVISAVGLPISILLELKYGLLAGAIADISGLLAMTALTAMLFGLLRYTGCQDNNAGDNQ